MGQFRRSVLAAGIAAALVAPAAHAVSLNPDGLGNHASLTSLPSSMRVDVATGQVTPGAHSFRGLPVIGQITAALSLFVSSLDQPALT